MTITVDTPNITVCPPQGNQGSPYSFNHECGADVDALVVVITIYDTSSSDGVVSGVTYNGDPFDSPAATLYYDSLCDGHVSVWLLPNPDTGASYAVEISFGGAVTDLEAAAIGIESTVGTFTKDSNGTPQTGTSGDLSITWSTIATDTIAFSASLDDQTDAAKVHPQETVIYNVDVGDVVSAQYVIRSSDGSQTMIVVDDDGDEDWVIVGAAFKEVAGVTQVNKDLQADWDILNLVNKDTQADWDILNLVNKDIQADWDIFELVNKDTQAIWDITELVNKDLEGIWDITELVNKDLEGIWDIFDIVNKDLQAQWDIFDSVNKDIQAIWDITELVNKDIQAIWDMEGAVSKDLQAVWDITELVNKDLQADWDIFILVNKDIQAVWDMSQLAGRSIQGIWDIEGIVYKDIQADWDIFNTVNKDLQGVWDIDVLVNKDLEAIWDLLGAVGSRSILGLWRISSISRSIRRFR